MLAMLPRCSEACSNEGQVEHTVFRPPIDQLWLLMLPRAQVQIGRQGECYSQPVVYSL